MHIEFEKGHDAVNFALADEKVLGVLLGKDVPGIGEEAISSIIAEGISKHVPAGITGMKTVLIIPDDTRLWARGHLYVPVILQTLFDLGLSPEQVKIIIALGTHRDISQEKFATLAGRIAAERVQILNSANKNNERLTFIGKTTRKTEITLTKEAAEAEHVIIFGGVLHHMLAGYGGGRKYIMPGIAGYDCIQQNHSLAMQEDGAPHPLVRQARLVGNPVHEDCTEAVDLFLQKRTCTYVAVAANGAGEIFHAQVGPLKETFLSCCSRLDEVCCVPVADKGDFVLLSAGGYRTDGQLYQATKALFNGVNVIREGGRILFVAACAEGFGNSEFAETLIRYKGEKKSLGKPLSRSFTMPSYVAFRVLDLLERYEIALISDLSRAQTEELGFNYIDDLQNYVHNLQGKGYIIPFAEYILPVLEETRHRASAG